MDRLGEKLDQWRTQLVEEFAAEDYVSSFQDKILSGYQHVEQYWHNIKNTDPATILDDFKSLKVTPVSVTLTLTAVTTILLFGKVLSLSKSLGATKPKKGPKKKKKVSPAQKANKQIHSILDYVEEEYVPKIDEYLENYKKLSLEDLQYQYRYFEEMLLKELVKLDGIDVVGNDILRDNRRKVIKFIQDHQKRLDAFKKEIKLELT